MVTSYIRAFLAGALAVAFLAPGGAFAQETRVDSLERRVAALEELVRSLQEEVRRLRAERPGPEAPEEAAEEPGAPGRAEREAQEEAGELAALREAARDAAREAEPRRDTTEAEGSRTRSLQLLNPEISVTGDVVGLFSAPEAGESEFTAVPREFEFSFQSALDPYTHTKIFFTRHEDLPFAGLDHGGIGEHDEDEGDADHEHEGEEGPESDPHEAGEEEGEEEGFEIEEAYMYWVGLPGGLGVKLGKFRQEIGLYNRWHTHALLEVERPLAVTAFLGEEGLVQTGASVSLPGFLLGPATQDLTFEVTRADNPLFRGGTELSYLGRAQSFFDLGPTGYFQVGATGVLGRNDEIDLDSRLLGLDASFKWSPAGRSLYRELTLRGEWYFAEQDLGEQALTGRGGYLQANYRLDRRWIAGLRADYLDAYDGAEAFQLVPTLTWWQSEWVRLRLQYNLLKREGFDPDHTLLFQTVWAVGPHKHETY